MRYGVAGLVVPEVLQTFESAGAAWAWGIEAFQKILKEFNGCRNICICTLCSFADLPKVPLPSNMQFLASQILRKIMDLGHTARQKSASRQKAGAEMLCQTQLVFFGHRLPILKVNLASFSFENCCIPLGGV